MNLPYFIDRLSHNAGVFKSFLTDISPEQARWKPSPDKWSLVEVVNHLYDEERDDFRTRLDHVLHHPGKTWPPIDPPRWAIEREYIKRELAASVENFLAERTKSIAWLRELSSPDLSASYELGQVPRSAGDLLVSWLAHDLIHIRQMTRLHFEYLTAVSRPFSPDYAGVW